MANQLTLDGKSLLISQADPMQSQGPKKWKREAEERRTRKMAPGQGCDLPSLALKMEKERRGPEGQRPLKLGKEKGTLPRASRRKTAC